MANSGSGKGCSHRLGTFLKLLVVSLLLPIIVTGFFVTPTIRNSTVRQLLNDYYGKVTRPNQRLNLYYSDDLTPGFRSNNSWSSFTGWWQEVKSVKVNWVSVSGDSAQVSLTYHMSSGTTVEETDQFWFVCKGLFGTSLLSGLRSGVYGSGCPLQYLEIDNQKPLTAIALPS